jgi:hypothetical protein
MGEILKASTAASGFQNAGSSEAGSDEDDHWFSEVWVTPEHRPESIALVMSKWKMERDIAEKAFDLMLKTWSDNGQASDPALQAGIEESLKVSSSKQSVPLSRVADFNFVREVYRELKTQ